MAPKRGRISVIIFSFKNIHDTLKSGTNFIYRKNNIITCVRILIVELIFCNSHMIDTIRSKTNRRLIASTATITSALKSLCINLHLFLYYQLNF